jgi:translation elongation factor EF-1alpha
MKGIKKGSLISDASNPAKPVKSITANVRALRKLTIAFSPMIQLGPLKVMFRFSKFIAKLDSRGLDKIKLFC